MEARKRISGWCGEAGSLCDMAEFSEGSDTGGGVAIRLVSSGCLHADASPECRYG
jgi:hypothetical protein